MSYVRKDDEHENGRLTAIRKRLEGEVRMQTGRPFSIFQDQKDIAWGNNWKERIDEGVDAVTFLIPVITPSFFRSTACREEFARFRAREAAMERSDLILPLYYVETDEFSDEALREADAMARVMVSRQYFDWRHLRLEPLTSLQVGKAFASMAKQIKAALPGAPPRPAKAKTTRRAEVGGIERAQATVAESTRQAPVPRSEPHTVTVDALHRGDYATITKAIEKEPPGTRILVRPGYYPEGIVMDKPLEIIGDGLRDEIVVAAMGCHTVLFQTTMGRVANLTLQQEGGGNWYGVAVAQGRLHLEDCDISSEGLACIVVRDGADPVVRGNRIHDAKNGGIYIFSGSRGTFEDNEVFANASGGFAVDDGGNPVVRGNLIHDNGDSGIYIFSGSRGTFEDNEVFANASSGFGVGDGGDPVVRSNRIHNNGSFGVAVLGEGRGTFEDNEIFGNALDGFLVDDGGDPIVRGNRIHQNRRGGIWVDDGGRGTYEKNHIWGNAKGPWDIAADAGEVIRRDNVEEPPADASF